MEKKLHKAKNQQKAFIKANPALMEELAAKLKEKKERKED